MFGLNWKPMLAALVIVAIGVMLLQTEGGRQYMDGIVDSARSGLGGIVSGMFSAGGILGPKMPAGEGFKIVLDSNREAFEGQAYSLSNSSIYVSGVCVVPVRIDDVGIAKGLKDCVIEVPAAGGAADYTAGGTLKFSGTTTRIVVDGETYEPAAGSGAQKQLKVSFEVIPKQSMVTGLVEPNIVLQSVRGNIKRFSKDGVFRGEENLESDRLEIGGFEGHFKVEDSNIITLQGIAVSVRGTGTSSSFAW